MQTFFVRCGSFFHRSVVSWLTKATVQCNSSGKGSTWRLMLRVCMYVTKQRHSLSTLGEGGDKTTNVCKRDYSVD